MASWKLSFLFFNQGTQRDGSFWVPKTYVYTDGLENNYNFKPKNFDHLDLRDP